MHDELLELKSNNFISKKKYEGGGDGEEQLSIVHFVHPSTHETDSKKWPSMETGWAGFKNRVTRIFSSVSGRHIIIGPTYFRDDIFPGPHDIRWFSAHGFCRWFSISG
jgi:hypothetical protein